MTEQSEEKLEKLKDKKFLIVDDDPEIIQVLQDQFELFEVQIDTANNGEVAYGMILKKTYDLVISDIRMPECSGIKLLEKMRESDQKMPEVILISGFTDVTEQKAKELGAKGLYLKPQILANLFDLIDDIF